MFKEMSLQATSTVSTIKDEFTGNFSSVQSTTSSTSSIQNSSVGDSVIQSIINTTSSLPDQHDPQSDVYEMSILCIKGIIFVSIIIGAVLGNALVIISVHKNRKLR